MLYVSFGSKVRPRTFEYVAWVVQCCFFTSRSLLYSAGSGVARVQVVLSAFSVKLL